VIKYPDDPGDYSAPEENHNDRQRKYQKYRSNYQSGSIHIPVYAYN
jgi:hypothetical protein